MKLSVPPLQYENHDRIYQVIEGLSGVEHLGRMALDSYSMCVSFLAV